jgi:FkbM family methyltransferase
MGIKPELDMEWLIRQAKDAATSDKIREIAVWRDEMFATNSFIQDKEPFLLSLEGVNLRFYPYSAVASLEVYQEIFRYNDHRLLPDFIGKEAMVLLDVGANQGMYALRAKRENPACKVYCFEPNPVEYTVLLENIRLNDVEGVETFNLAIGDSINEIDFEYLPNAGAISGRGIRTVPRNWMREEFISTCRIMQTTLDDFCESNNIMHIDILKIDTEGMEMEVLSGSKKILSICDRIVIERHSAELRHSVVQALDATGFDLVHEEDDTLSRYYADIYFRKKQYRS